MDTSLGRWADYSGGRPGGTALRSSGFVGALRYVGLGSAGKRLTAAEYTDLRAAGLDVLLVAELGTGDAWGGYNAGLVNARAALNDARALGVPDSVGIAAAADAHATPTQVAAAVAYVRAFRDVLGHERTGCYGFSEVVQAVQQDGSASWFWQSGTAPATGAGVHFWQRNTAPTVITVSGVPCDINEHLIPVTGGSVMDWTDTIGHRKDGSIVAAGDALVNLYLGAYQGGGDAGAAAVYPTVNSLKIELDALTQIVATLSPQLQAIQTALAKLQLAGVDPAAVAAAIAAHTTVNVTPGTVELGVR